MGETPPLPRASHGGHRKARRAFWVLVGIAILAAGSLSSALGSPPSPLTGLRVAGSGLVLIGSLALATRIMAALGTRGRSGVHK